MDETAGPGKFKSVSRHAWVKKIPPFGREADETVFDCPLTLSADFAAPREDTPPKALAAGADVVNFDVMDNHYVPNLTIGPMVLKAPRQYGIGQAY